MLQDQVANTYNWLFLANPTEKYARQWSSSALPQSSTGSHICQLNLHGIADYIVFVTWSCNFWAKLLVMICYIYDPDYNLDVQDTIEEPTIFALLNRRDLCAAPNKV